MNDTVELEYDADGNLMVAVTDARASLKSLVARINDKGERMILTKHGQPTAALIGMPDLASLKAADALARSALSWPLDYVGEAEDEPLFTHDVAADLQLRYEAEDLLSKTVNILRTHPELTSLLKNVLREVNDKKGTERAA